MKPLLSMLFLISMTTLWGMPLHAQSLQPGEFSGSVGSLPLVLQVAKDDKGTLSCTLDSPNQGAFGIPCSDLHFEGSSLSFRVPSVNGNWKGTVSENGATLTGNWSQGTPMPLVFTRQAQRSVRPEPTPPTFDEAMAPVEAAQLEAVLREDLKSTLSSGVLAPGKNIGVTVGVITRGGHRVFALGDARPDALFEIGSITKTFTGLLMAQLIEQGKVLPETPVRALLPEGTVAKPEGAEITLLDLVTQHSGLPRLPTNLQPRDPANPYADYDAERLYAFMREYGVAKPADAGFLYSNLGVGLLGHVLGLAAHQSYPELLATQVLQPLGLADTAIELTAAQHARFITGHGANLAPAHSWDLGALAGAGALRSTAADMLHYLEANLDPDSVKATGTAARTLPAALKRSHELQADAMPGTRIAYAWLVNTANGTWWHNGGTGGFTSFAFFNPREGFAGVVLVNLTVDSRGSLADTLGQHIEQRLAGQPAISLTSW